MDGGHFYSSRLKGCKKKTLNESHFNQHLPLHASYLKLSFKSWLQHLLKGKSCNLSVSHFPPCWIIIPIFNCYCGNQRTWKCPGLSWALLLLLVRLSLGPPLIAGTQPHPHIPEVVTRPVVFQAIA